VAKERSNETAEGCQSVLSSAVQYTLVATAQESIPLDAHIYLTVADSDENEVLELVRVDETGMYTRNNGAWAKIDPEADNERVWDRIIIDVKPGAVQVYDAAPSGSVTADMFTEYLVPEEQQQ
jgi:ABC-type uncharacterized transport system auxiliary subunit